jgi:hypothetical protein
VQSLDRLLTAYPDYAPARGGRGVLLARLGKADEAVRDAEAGLRRDPSPVMVYQAGCIYALTSRQRPDDRLRALQFLATALRQGFGRDLVTTDDDLNPLRGMPEFQRLVDGAQHPVGQ